jgi:hypothetical protein
MFPLLNLLGPQRPLLPVRVVQDAAAVIMGAVIWLQKLKLVVTIAVTL